LVDSIIRFHQTPNQTVREKKFKLLFFFNQ